MGARKRQTVRSAHAADTGYGIRRYGAVLRARRPPPPLPLALAVAVPVDHFGRKKKKEERMLRDFSARALAGWRHALYISAISLF